MQTKPSGWADLFAASHKTEYKFVIDGVDYTKSNIQGTPIITKPYMDKFCIGRCCSGTLKLQIRPIDDITIPKAASVVAYCRLRSQDGATVTDWVEQGHYYISSRKKNGELLTLVCRDAMVKAGTSYLDHTAFTEWPITMTEAVNEIASVMGIAIDSRTVVSTGTDYVVSYPNDLLMSEVLSMIAAVHGGNFIVTEKNELRLLPIPLIQTTAENKCDIGTSYQVYEEESTTQQITRITLEDDAGNKFSAGDDTGAEIAVKCSYATQNIADDLCDPVNGKLYGVKYIPYSVKGAYLDPCIELGDILRLTSRGTGMHRMIAAMSIRCNVSFNADVSCRVDVDDEEEFPYISARDLQASRYIRTDQKYHGNRIDRVNGFTSEYMVNGQVAARLVANSNVFSMQRVVDGSWEDCIYFDAATQKYVITGNVTIKGIITAESLSTAGQTTINGANITTGILKSKDGKIQLDLDAGTFKVGDKDLNAALTAVENSITLIASSQIFTKAADATEYSPSSITLTAETTGTLTSYSWYLDDVLISGATARTLTVAPNDFTANSATYKVVGKDAAGNTYTDCISIAKLSDGKDGADGANGKDGVSYYTWIKYADTPTSGMSDNPDGKKYMGLAYNKTTATESTNYSDYDWSLIKGADGVSGPKGADGTTYYTWVKYADDASGTNMADDPTGKEYIGLAYNKTTPTESNVASDYTWALFKGSDGVDGKDGAAGPAGVDGYTVMLSNEFIEVPVNTDRKPLAAASYTCKVDVYKGLSALTPTTGNLSASYFKVAVTNTVPGVTVAQSTAGTLTVSVNTTTAIVDSTEIALSITVYNGPTLSAKITVRANMNDVTVAQQASIKLNSDNIELKVSKDGVISAINQSAEEITIDARRLNLNGYVTISSLENGTTTINGSCITTGTIDASKVNVTNLNASNIKSGTLSANYISGGTIDASKVTVKNLDASSITTGTLSADRIDTSTLKAQKLYTSSNQIALMSVGSQYIYIGGDSSWNINYLHIYADTAVRFVPVLTSSSNDLIIEMSVSKLSLHPASDNTWDLGTITYGFKGVYANNIYCRNGNGVCGSSSYPFATGYIEKLYLSSNCYLTASGTSLCVNGTAITASSTVSKIYAGTSTIYYAELNSSYAFVPSSTAYDFSLGSSSYPWKKAYITSLYLNGTLFSPTTVDTSKIAYSSTVYASMNASKQFIPSASTGYYLGSSTYPWQYAYITNLYINGTKFNPSSDVTVSKLSYSSSIYASINASKQFIPAASTGYYLGSSTYPWQYAYITNLYINGTKFDPSSSSSGSGDFAGSLVKMGGSTSYYILCNTSRELRPYSTSTTYPCYLGTSTYYWHYAYLGSNTVMLGSSSSSKLGFFGTTAVYKQTVSSSATVATLISALKSYGLI